jgi:5'-3' exonuclease
MYENKIPEVQLDVVVIDATNLLHRCHHAKSSTLEADLAGNPCWAISGVFNYTTKLIQKWRPSKFIVAFDIDGCPSRKVLAPDYKAGRNTPAPELVDQLKRAPELFRQAGFAVGEVSGWEADDVCATVAAKAKGNVGIVSSDKDIHQLSSDNCTVLKPEGIVYTPSALKAKYGVSGPRWVEFAALCGEAADNLEGVNGIGPKRAIALLERFDDIEDAFAHPEQVIETVGASSAAKLQAGVEIFRRNRKVGTLKTDLSLGTHGYLPTATQVRNALRDLGYQRTINQAEYLLAP